MSPKKRQALQTSLLTRIRLPKVTGPSKFLVYGFLAAGFWYFSLFPGRLGFDSSEAIRMIRSGESTDWWTSTFFWFLRLSTFQGKSIALSSLIIFIVMLCSLLFLINSLPFSQPTRNLTFFYMNLMPVFWAFALTVSHDAFQCAAILLLVGYELRLKQKNLPSNRIVVILLLVVVLLLTTSWIGKVLIALLAFRLLWMRKVKTAIAVITWALFVISISSIGLEKHDPMFKVYWMLADLKCVAQHEQARLDQADWRFLKNIALEDEWLQPYSCTTVDEPVGILKSINKEVAKPSKYFFTGYSSIVIKNPSLVGMAHIMRSRGALPPPFFPGPSNQVELDPTVPIGQGTNIALQSGPSFLHPSIDEDSVDPDYALMKPFEYFAQGLMFVINQASWFWGWGGMWLLFLFYVCLTRICKKNFIGTLKLLWPILTVHGMLVLIGPSPLPRYVIGATLMGLVCLISLTIDWKSRTSKSQRPDFS